MVKIPYRATCVTPSPQVHKVKFDTAVYHHTIGASYVLRMRRSDNHFESLWTSPKLAMYEYDTMLEHIMEYHYELQTCRLDAFKRMLDSFLENL